MKSHFEVVKNQKSETFRSIANAVNRFAQSQCVTIPFKDSLVLFSDIFQHIKQSFREFLISEHPAYGDYVLGFIHVSLQKSWKRICKAICAVHSS